MSEIKAFMSTWQSARDTFGEGTPQDGTSLDASGKLEQSSSDVRSAAPTSQWTGPAATEYGTTNSTHAGRLAKMAGLDRRLGAEVTNSANVVAAGRRNLDTTRRWVADAVANIPDTVAGDNIRAAIASRGLGEVIETIQRSNGDLSDIGRRLTGIGEEYQALGDGMKEGPEVGTREDGEEDLKKDAQQDVEDALNGDKDAAARVAGVLDGITPGQLLTPEQSSYLSQMQAQQNLRPVENLRDVEAQLGDQGHIIGDSWQLMSNQRVTYPHTDSVDGALDDPATMTTGGFDQLPQSVQQVISSDGMQYPERLQEIAGIVKDGQPQFQQNTDLDRELLNKADRMMDTGIFEKDARSSGNDNGLDLGYDAIIGDVFEATSDDHQAVHNHVLGLSGADGQDFLRDINRHAWADDGADASTLFSWTENAWQGPESDLSSRMAEAYGNHLGNPGAGTDYLHLPGDRTLGELNPALVQGYAHGLSPYVADIAGLSTADATGVDAYENPDLGNNDKPIAKGIFSVLSTDPEASKQFNGVAYAHAAAAQAEWAEAVRTHGDVAGLNARQLDAAIVNGLVDVGIKNADFAGGVNSDHRAQAVWDQNKQAWDFGTSLVEKGVGYVPKVGDYLGQGVDYLSGSLENTFIGDRPLDKADYQVIQTWDDGRGGMMVLNSLFASNVGVPDIPANWLIDTGSGMRLGTPTEILIHNGVTVDETVWSNAVTNALTNTVGSAEIADNVANWYNTTTRNPDP